MKKVIEDIDSSNRQKVSTFIRDILNHNIVYREENNCIDYNDTLYFRGESSEHKFRTPSLYLNEKLAIQGSERYYRNLLNELGANDYSNNSSLVRKMAELQHYGAKTRMLDITKNPLIALYFAVEKDDDRTGCVYIYHSNNREKFDTGHTVAIKTAMSLMPQNVVNEFLKACEKLLSINPLSEIELLKLEDVIGEIDSSYSKSIEKFMELINQRARTHERLVYPLQIYRDLKISHIVSPSKATDRIRQQQGAFIFPCFVNTENKVISEIKREIHESIQDLSMSLYTKESSKKNEEEIITIKRFPVITVSGGYKKYIREELKLLGITPGFIYSDIEHQSKSLLDQL